LLPDSHFEKETFLALADSPTVEMTNLRIIARTGLVAPVVRSAMRVWCLSLGILHGDGAKANGEKNQLTNVL